MKGKRPPADAYDEGGAHSRGLRRGASKKGCHSERGGARNLQFRGVWNLAGAAAIVPHGL